MRKFRSLVLGVALAALIAVPAMATHSIIEFSVSDDSTLIAEVPNGATGLKNDPGSGTVDVGTPLDLYAEAQADATLDPTGNQRLQFHVCYLKDRTAGDAAILTMPMAIAVCEVENPDPLLDGPDGVWVQVGTNKDLSSTDRSHSHADFSTTGFGEMTVGLRAQFISQGGHTGAQRYIDIAVVTPTNGDDGHPGCKGILNAYAKVTDNHGASKSNGKGAEALEKVSDRLGCGL